MRIQEEQTERPQGRSTRGRKALIVLGILFIVSGVFLGSFVCSFHMMIQAAAEARNHVSGSHGNPQAYGYAHAHRYSCARSNRCADPQHQL